MWRELEASEVISGSQGELYITINGERKNIAQGKNIEAKVEKEKTEIGVLGKTGKIAKATSWKGTGSLTIYYNSSLFRKLMIEYIKTGKDFYFDMIVTNEDKTATIGRQTTVLKGCNFNSMILAKINIDDDVLDEELEFTFQDVEMPEEFKEI